VANVVREAAAIIERSISASPERSLPAVVQHARAGADLLDSTALLIETAGDDEMRWEQAARTADVAFDTLVATFTLAGGNRQSRASPVRADGDGGWPHGANPAPRTLRALARRR
jgi:hypothetical protein